MSGLAFAFHAARAGRSVLVLEKETRPGGCLGTHRTGEGFWFELGAHTCYNSYTALCEILDACGLRKEVLPRAKTKLRFLDGDRLVPGANLAALLRALSWREVITSLPGALGASKEWNTVQGYYSALIGKRNYDVVLASMFAAVMSQSADLFPADMVFKARASRRKDYPRSFTLRGGLSTICDAMARQARVEVITGSPIVSIEEAGTGFAAVCQDGTRHEAGIMALATPPSSAARLLGGVAPELASQAAQVDEARVETVGFAVKAEKMAQLPVSMFLVPLGGRDELFHSIVTRDPVPDPAWRGFAVHFKSGHPRALAWERSAEVLGLVPLDLQHRAERISVLPSPALGHKEIIDGIDRRLAGMRLCLTGNWFTGLAIEDCVGRSRSEWRRVANL